MEVARVRERIERAKMVCRETENFMMVGSTLFSIDVHGTSRPSVITVSE